MCDPEKGEVVRTAPPPPLKNHKNIGFSCNIDQDPLKITKLPSQQSMMGHYRHVSETPFPWRADDGPLLVAFRSSLHSINNKKQNKIVVSVEPPLTKVSESVHETE